jgi:hypothetical protein
MQPLNSYTPRFISNQLLFYPNHANRERDIAGVSTTGGQLTLYGTNRGQAAPSQGSSLLPAARAALASSVMIPTADGGSKEYVPSAAIARKAASKWPRPQWHAPWKNYRVISGHLGCVACICVPNECCALLLVPMAPEGQWEAGLNSFRKITYLHDPRATTRVPSSESSPSRVVRPPAGGCAQ